MTLILTAGAPIEPVTLDEAKAHLRLDGSDEDLLITSLIVTSRLHVEQALGLALITQGWSWLLDAWPDPTILRLPMRPIQAITAVRTYAEDGTTTTFASDAYLLDGAGAPARLVLRRGRAWPIPGRSANGIEIAFQAGFGTEAASVPAPIRQAILHLVAHWYENREPAELGSASTPVPPAVSGLLAPYREVRL